jgi:hypothetical protein
LPTAESGDFPKGKSLLKRANPNHCGPMAYDMLAKLTTLMDLCNIIQLLFIFRQTTVLSYLQNAQAINLSEFA